MSTPFDRSRLDRLHARLQLLARCDTGLQVFGADTHAYQLAPPLTEAELLELERSHGVELPDDYRAFITTLGNGGAGPFYGLAPLRADPPKFGAALDEHMPPSLARPFPLTEPWQQGGEPGQPPIPAGTSVYDGVVELSSHGCGYFDLLIVTGPKRGEVWADFTQELGGLAPWYPSFFDAYEAWLERGLVEWACASPFTVLDDRADHIDEALQIVEPLLERAVAELSSRPGNRAEVGNAPADPALLHYPQDPTAILEALANLRIRQARPDQAHELLDLLPARSSKDGEARRELGRTRLYAMQDQPERALEAVAAGLACSKLWFATEVDLLDEQRAILRGLGRDDEALEVSRRLADKQSRDLFAQYDLVWELIERERFDDAAACLIAAAERGVGCDREAPLAERIMQCSAEMFAAIEREGTPEQAAALRERLVAACDAN